MMGQSHFDDFDAMFDSVPLRTRTLSPPLARRGDRKTALEAAGFITPKRLEDRIRFAWECEDPTENRTADEICDLLPDDHPPTVKTALSRMAKAGLVWTDGNTRPSKRGRESLVWHLVPRP